MLATIWKFIVLGSLLFLVIGALSWATGPRDSQDED
jgi:hypothetical protein